MLLWADQPGNGRNHQKTEKWRHTEIQFLSRSWVWRQSWPVVVQSDTCRLCNIQVCHQRQRWGQKPRVQSSSHGSWWASCCSSLTRFETGQRVKRVWDDELCFWMLLKDIVKIVTLNVYSNIKATVEYVL